MSTSPTLVFVPGAWHKPTCYDKIIHILQDQHHLKCVAITLPSTTDNPNATFKDDVDAARQAIYTETSQGRDVVVLARSYGGMVGNSAVKGFTRPKSQSTTEPQSSSTGHVIGIVLIASGYTWTGVAFMDPFFGQPPPSWRVNKETGFAELVLPPQKVFYHDLPAGEAEYWTSQLSSQSLKSLFEGGEHSYSGWLDVPSWYIGTIEDYGLPVVVQRMQVGMARSMGAIVEHRELQTSHSPFLSKPEETVEIITQAVAAFRGVEKTPSATPRPTASLIPQARLSSPVTWVKYGLPYFFGRIIGKCVLGFTWTRRLWRRT
ncbi:hypothetical protein B0A52_07933 [Exophiala mesophila]|uniref:AB hydrolase-1 domain-containing protein n=1 Tax=Exophiala mesophila TaxID=212818 RepID=A0A438MZF3_EXOME|nr:hypothetical protein B0A52_07933 [Exophiala mesophila]